MYHIDVRTALWGNERQGFRRLLRLIENLPPGSAVHIATHGQAAMWSTDHELLAILIELVHHQTRTIAKGFGAKQDVRALKLPRPYDEAERDAGVQRLESGEDLAAVLGLRKVG